MVRGPFYDLNGCACVVRNFTAKEQANESNIVATRILGVFIWYSLIRTCSPGEEEVEHTRPKIVAVNLRSESVIEQYALAARDMLLSLSNSQPRSCNHHDCTKTKTEKTMYHYQGTPVG